MNSQKQARQAGKQIRHDLPRPITGMKPKIFEKKLKDASTGNRKQKKTKKEDEIENEDDDGDQQKFETEPNKTEDMKELNRKSLET